MAAGLRPLWLNAGRALAQVQQAREAAQVGTALQVAQQEQVQRHTQRLDKLAGTGGEPRYGQCGQQQRCLERAEALTKRLRPPSTRPSRSWRGC